jgi:glycine cleavage system H lipoate-binding protein
MHTVIEILQVAGVFLGGILARLGLFVAALAALVLPALAIALAVRTISARRERALGIRRVSGLLFRPDLFYAPGHTWLRPRGARRGSWRKLPRSERGDRGGARAQPECPPATMELGIDDLAQRLLVSVTAVELPRPGTTFAKGDVVAVLHGGGRAVPVRAPVAGAVAGVNAAVLRDPALVKRDGLGRGWLVVLSPTDASFADLPRGEAAESWLRREAARWSRFLEERLGFSAADGGELVAPAPWLVGEAGWAELTTEFLQV